MLRKRILAASTATVLALGMSVGGAGAAFATPGGQSQGKTEVVICHAKGPDAKNGWTQNKVDDDSIVKNNGHDSHAADIIPSFEYRDDKGKKKTYPGKNLGDLGSVNSEYKGITGASVLANDCKLPPKPTPTPTTPPPTTIESLKLSFVPDCLSNVNLWRVTNPNSFAVKTNLFGDVEPGTTEFPLSDGKNSITLKWGGGDTGVKPGEVKATAGKDLSTAKFQYSWNGSNGFTVKVTADGCSTGESLNVSSYTLDKSAQNNSTRFGEQFTYPQTLFSHAEDIVLPPRTEKLSKGMEFTRTVAVPDCGDYQADLYSGEKLDVVDSRGHDIPGKSKFLAGGIVLQEECATLDAAPFVTQAQCVVDDNGNVTGEATPGSVDLGQLPAGISSASVFVSVDGQLGDEVSDLDALEAGDYVVVATAKSNHRILVNNGWVLGENGTATFSFTIDEIDCTPVVPDEPLIESTEWVFSAADCLSQEVTETRMTTTTTYVVRNNQIVIDEVVTVEDTQTRPMTEEELDEYCPIPEQPGDLLVVGSWVVGEFDCDDTTVVQTRTVTTTPFELEGREWVAGEPRVEVQTETRDLTAEEIASLDCAVDPIDPPVVDPPLDFDPPTLGTASVAFTYTAPTCDLAQTVEVNVAGSANASLESTDTSVPGQVTFVFIADEESVFNESEPPVFDGPGSEPSVSLVEISDDFSELTVVVQVLPANEELCDEEVPPVLTDLPTLALTGASGMLGTLGILALLITLTGIGVVATRRRVVV